MNGCKVSAIFLVFFVLVGGIGWSNDDGKLSEKDRETIKFIQEVKKFGASLGFVPTKNFKEYRDKASAYNLFFYNKKTDVPYSYIDPQMEFKESEYDNLKDSVENYEIATKTYDVYFYTTMGVAGGTFITRNLLESERPIIAEVVLHEDCHDNMCLPRQFDEGTALVVGIVGSARFMKLDEDEFHYLIGFVLAEAKLLNGLYDGIKEMNDEMKKGERSFSSYLEIRDMKLSMTWYSSLTEISQNRTYKLHTKLLLHLLEVMDWDLARFIAYMKELPEKEPKWENDPKKYFEETLVLEKEAVSFIENTISEMEKSKKEKAEKEPVKKIRFFNAVRFVTTIVKTWPILCHSSRHLTRNKTRCK